MTTLRKLLAILLLTAAPLTAGSALATYTPAAANVNSCLSQNVNLVTGRAICNAYGDVNAPNAIAVRVNCRNTVTGQITNGHLGNRVDVPHVASTYTCPYQWVISGTAGIQFYYY